MLLAWNVLRCLMKSTIFTIFKLIPNWTFAFVNAHNCTTVFFLPPWWCRACFVYPISFGVPLFNTWDWQPLSQLLFSTFYFYNIVAVFAWHWTFFFCEICSHSTEHIFFGLLGSYFYRLQFFLTFCFRSIEKHVYSSLFKSINHWFGLCWLAVLTMRTLTMQIYPKRTMWAFDDFFLLFQYLHFLDVFLVQCSYKLKYAFIFHSNGFHAPSQWVFGTGNIANVTMRDETYN